MSSALLPLHAVPKRAISCSDPAGPADPTAYGSPMSLHGWVVRLEHAWDSAGRRRGGAPRPAHFRTQPYVGHGSAAGVVVRGRVFDDPPVSEAVEGEGAAAAVRRTLRGFLTDELPGVPLRVSVAGSTVSAVTDDDGYFLVRLHPEPDRL